MLEVVERSFGGELEMDYFGKAVPCLNLGHAEAQALEVSAVLEAFKCICSRTPGNLDERAT